MNEGMQFGGTPLGSGRMMSDQSFGGGIPLGGMRSPKQFGGSPFMDDPSFSSSPYREQSPFGGGSQRSPFGFNDTGSFGSGRREPAPIQMHQPVLASIPSLSPMPGEGGSFDKGGLVPKIDMGKLGTSNANQIIIANLVGNITPPALKAVLGIENIKYVDELEPLCSNNTIAYVINTFGVNIPELERKVSESTNLFNSSKSVLKTVDGTLEDAVEDIITEWQNVKYVIANIRPEFNATQFKLLLRHAKTVAEDAGLGTLISNEAKAFVVTFSGLEANYSNEIDSLSEKIFCGEKYYEIITGKLESTVNSIFKAMFIKEQKRVSRWIIAGLKKDVTALEVKVNLKNTEAVIPSVLLQPLCQGPNNAYLVYISAKSVDAASDISSLPLFNEKPLFAEIQKGNIQNAIEVLLKSGKEDVKRKQEKSDSSDREYADGSEEEEPNYIKFLIANLPPECTNDYLKKKLPSVVKITTDSHLEKLNRGMRHSCIANFTSKDCKNELKEFCKGKYGKMHPKITVIKDSIEDAISKILDYKTNAKGNWLTIPLEKINITKSDTYKDRELAVLNLVPEIVPQYIVIHQKNVYIDYNSEEKCKRASEIINST